MNSNKKTSSRIRILIADDQRLFRQSLKALLEGHSDLEVIGEAGNGREAVVLATDLKPDVILLDAEMPEMDGPSAALLIHKRLPEIKILMLSVYDDDRRVRESMAAGAVGYIIKDADHREFYQIIQSTVNGQSVESPYLVEARKQKTGALSVLTPRAREILELLSDGLSNKEIAHAAGVSPETVKTHLQQIYEKLGVRNRAGAIRVFLDQSTPNPS